jgi:hypothetical protein
MPLDNMPQDNLPSFDPSLLSGFLEDSEKRKDSSYVYDKKRLSNWDKRYIKLAAHVAEWSKDPDAKVGCVIVSPTHGRAVTFSFNGFPANISDSLERLHHEDENEKLDRESSTLNRMRCSTPDARPRGATPMSSVNRSATPAPSC